jgi:hypothetical protein
MLKQPEKTIQANALRLLQAIEEATRGLSNPVVVTEELSNLGMNEQEVKAAYDYLQGKGLIKTFNLTYAATLSPSA